MQMTDFCDHLYNESTDGYIQILKLNDENNSGERTIKIYNTKNDGLRDIVEELHKKEDVFLAPNTMYIPKRRVENIRQFRALFQDIDCESMGLEKAETVYMIWIMHYEGKIPKPTMVTDSGRGVHLYWRIQNAPFGALNTWQELQDYIYYNLKHLGADKKATDGARVLRLPGTINSKCDANCEVLYIDNDVEYSMYELREEYLNYKPKTHQLKMQQTKKIDNKVISNRFFNSYSLHMERANDLETLCRLRKYEMTGYRNMAVHCFAYWKGIYVRDNYELENIVIEFNNAFTEPLKETEVQAVLRCIPKAIDKFIAYEQGLRSGERKRVSKGMRDKEGYWYPVRISNMVLAYNPEKTKKENLAQSFKEFAEKESLTGKISMSDPLKSGTALAAIGGLKDKYKDEYFTNLAKRKVAIEAGSVALTKLETGEMDELMILEESVLKKRQDDNSSLEVIYPKDGTIVVPSPIMIVDEKLTENKNTKAAEAISKWFLSEEGQKFIVKGWMHSVLKDFPEVPYDAIKTSEITANSINVNWEQLVKDRDSLRKMFTDTIGKK